MINYLFKIKIKTKPSCLSQESESFFELVNSDLKNIDIACICNSLSFFTVKIIQFLILSKRIFKDAK